MVPVRASPRELERLGRELSARPDLNGVFRTRAGAWRGFIELLHERELFEPVRARVPPPVQRLMDTPPLAVSWMPAMGFQFVFRALDELVSPEAFVQLAHDSVVKGPLRRMKPVIEGIIRIFGASPAAFLQKTPQLMASQVEGITFSIDELGEGYAIVGVCYDYLHDVPRVGFEYWRGAMQITFELCRREVRTHTEVLDEPPHNRALIYFDWR